jgi:hypothetical protein
LFVHVGSWALGEKRKSGRFALSTLPQPSAVSTTGVAVGFKGPRCTNASVLSLACWLQSAQKSITSSSANTLAVLSSAANRKFCRAVLNLFHGSVSEKMTGSAAQRVDDGLCGFPPK